MNGPTDINVSFGSHAFTGIGPTNCSFHIGDNVSEDWSTVQTFAQDRQVETLKLF